MTPGAVDSHIDWCLSTNNGASPAPSPSPLPSTSENPRHHHVERPSRTNPSVARVPKTTPSVTGPPRTKPSVAGAYKDNPSVAAKPKRQMLLGAPVDYKPVIIHDFVTVEEERVLLDVLRVDEAMKARGAQRGLWHISNRDGSIHLSQTWGVHLDYNKGFCSHREQFPPFIRDIVDKMKEVKQLKNWKPDQANGIIYIKKENHSLRPHTDHRRLTDDMICNLSLGCSAIMKYRKDSKRNTGKGAELPPEHNILLPQRSLQIMVGTFRYDYTHEIKNEDIHGAARTSITFRKCKPEFFV